MRRSWREGAGDGGRHRRQRRVTWRVAHWPVVADLFAQLSSWSPIHPTMARADTHLTPPAIFSPVHIQLPVLFFTNHANEL